RSKSIAAPRSSRSLLDLAISFDSVIPNLGCWWQGRKLRLECIASFKTFQGFHRANWSFGAAGSDVVSMKCRLIVLIDATYLMETRIIAHLTNNSAQPRNWINLGCEEVIRVYVMMAGLDLERLVLAAGPLGIMQAYLDVILPYVRQREQFGHITLLIDLLLQNMSNGYCFQDCAGIILTAAESATQVALQAKQCLGGNGYVNEYPTGRLLRDAKLYEIGAGTSEIRRMIIGRELFKEQW
ncbi:hypothetical protein S83_011484, partial [Arachis hypogaea]